MAQHVQDVGLRIVLKETRKRQNLLDLREAMIWHPLDRLEGHVIIQSAVPLTFDKVELRLEGT